MIKVAKILGAQYALVEAGMLNPYPSQEKAAQDATIAAMATPEEVGTVGEVITDADLASLEKVLSVLLHLQDMYRQQGAPQPPMQGAQPAPPQPPMQGAQPAPPQPPMQGAQPPAY